MLAANQHKSIILICTALLGFASADFCHAQAVVIGYTTATDDATTLTSVTISHDRHQRIYNAEKLISADVTHFRSSGGVNLSQSAKQTEDSAATRIRLLDRRLTDGVPNPGSSEQPPTDSPATESDNPTPGLAVRFDRPVTNRPGIDLVVFELQKGTGGDPFHISPLKFEANLRGITIDAYDIPADDSRAAEVAPITLHRFAAAPRTLADFTSGSIVRHSTAERGFTAAVVGIDLSRLGYADGQQVEGIFLQSVAGRPSFDPVAILGLPEPSPDNLLARAPNPPAFVPEQTELLKSVIDDQPSCEEIIFAQRVSGRDHWYGNFGHYCETESRYSDAALIKTGEMRYAFGHGSRLCRLNLRTGKLQVLLEDPMGGIRDPNIHYDGQKILFSYRKGGSTTYHLYEIGVDGTQLTQLTDGPDNDIEPIYTPDGGIVFCSSRCRRFVPCWRTQVATLYRCDADGSNIRMLSNNAEQENTPWMLPDGRVLYMRWEYVDRNQLLYHHLWTMNPDGTGVMVYFGNQHEGLAMLDAKPIPETNKVVACFSPGHGRAEHMGPIAVIDPRLGPDEMSMARTICSRHFRDPYPLRENRFLVADDEGIHLMDDEGRTSLVFKPSRHGARWSCHEPRPLRARRREQIVPDRTDLAQLTGRLVLSDIYEGRNMTGVRQGEIKKLLVLEQLPKPANFSGGPEPLTIGGTFTLERILGTVPVEPDGSAHMELPALRSLFFVALDENDMAVKRMQSFVTVQPGELTSCVGCHEQRTRSPHPRPTSTVEALCRPPSRIEAIDDIPDVIDFPRDVQPILDRHCIECHNPDRREGNVNLTGNRTPMYTTSYWTMFTEGLVSDGRNKQGNRAPRTIGSSASRLMKYLDGNHHKVKPTPIEIKTVRLWIESGATYPGTYSALGSGMQTVQFPEATIRRRCAKCHTATVPTYRNPKAGAFYFQFGRRLPPQPLLTDLDDIILIRHLAYFQLGESPLYQSMCNLDRPDKSLLLMAPLAKRSGGLKLCGRAIFEDTGDKDYQEILATIEDAAKRLKQHKRFDMPGFRPNRFYIREMQNFGILPKDLPDEVPVDGYTTDRIYWESFHHKPSFNK